VPVLDLKPEDFLIENIDGELLGSGEKRDEQMDSRPNILEAITEAGYPRILAFVGDHPRPMLYERQPVHSQLAMEVFHLGDKTKSFHTSRHRQSRCNQGGGRSQEP